MDKYNNRSVSKHYKGRVWITEGMSGVNICVELASGEFKVIGFRPKEDINDEMIIKTIEAMGWKPNDWL